MGFEPTTSSMPSRRAPNCATAPPEVTIYASTFGKVRLRAVSWDKPSGIFAQTGEKTMRGWSRARSQADSPVPGNNAHREGEGRVRRAVPWNTGKRYLSRPSPTRKQFPRSRRETGIVRDFVRSAAGWAAMLAPLLLLWPGGTLDFICVPWYIPTLVCRGGYA